jgi:hypothetical protein
MTKRPKSLSKGKTKAAHARVGRKEPAKRKPAGPDVIDALIDGSVRALALSLERSWRPGVKANLELTLRLAALFADFPLPDDAEPAPVFVA